MINFTKSMFSYSLAASLFGMKQMGNLFSSQRGPDNRHPATAGFENVTHCTVDEFGDTLRTVFHTTDRLQRGMVEVTSYFLFPFLLFTGSDRSQSREGQVADGPQRPTERRPVSNVTAEAEEEQTPRYAGRRV